MEAADGHDPTTAVLSNVTSRWPWHSLVPYLFGGLAAMLGLIALALLILAWSFWKLSGYLDGGSQEDGVSSEGNVEARTGSGSGKPVFEEKIVVIMAGEVKPTFLATPTISSRSSSFGDSSNNNCRFAATKSEKSEAVLENDAAKQGGSSHMQGLSLPEP